jgi:hypothetical protein
VADRQPVTLVTVEGVLMRCLDLTDGAIQDALGTSLTELTGEWWYTAGVGRTAPTHLLGRLAFETGAIQGLLYVSSKNPANGRCLAVFTDRLLPGEPSFIHALDARGIIDQHIP